MIIRKIKKSLAKIPPFKKVVVGVSGGADSVALAHLLKKLGYKIVIAHLNHSLRGKDSDKDAEFVEKLAQIWGVPFVGCKKKIPKKGNLENEARIMRYRFLEEARKSQKAKFIAVAHHLDDQIETILMHIKRGAGLRGMCGMKMKSDKIIRPLLSVKKKDLLDYLKKQKLSFRTDKTNSDLNFERNHMRHVVIPDMNKGWKNFDKKILKFSEVAKQRMKKIESYSKKWIKNNVEKDKFGIKKFLLLPDEIQSEVIFMLAGYIDVYEKNVKEVIGLIKKDITGKEKKIGGVVFLVQYGNVVVKLCRDAKFCVPTCLPTKKLTKKPIIWGDYKISYAGSDEIYVRQWQPGDRFYPSGMKGSKKLQDFFTDQKIPKPKRQKIPIIVDKKDNILAISDIRIAKDGKGLTKLINIDKLSI